MMMLAGLKCCRSSNNAHTVVDTQQPRGSNDDDKNTNTNVAGGTSANNNSGESIYYDARQSLSELLPYPPTSVSMAPGLRVSINEPQTLLYGGQHHHEERRSTVLRDSVIAAKNLLTRQRPDLQRCKGYPGELTNDELEACLQFREKLKKKEQQEEAYREMVYMYQGVEDEAFALCRYLRSRKFVVPDVFAMMDPYVDTWKAARNNNFYPDFEAAFGCPLSVFWSQFPLVFSGVAKSGAIVAYFQPGRIRLEEGMECIADIPEYTPLAWFLILHKVKDVIAKASQDHDPTTTTVLAEIFCIIDLNEMPASLLNQRVMDLLKEFFHILGCFPEILNRMVIVNVPAFFSMSWAILKAFIDPRTIAKIGFYSSQVKATNELRNLIDSAELLSDYGGSGPSFDATLAKQQERDGSCSRYIVERVCLSSRPRRDWGFAFDLATNEKATIVVYTKADGEAHFSLQKGAITLINQVSVKRKEGSAKHYSVEIEDNVVGPGKFKIAAKSNTSSKDHYLVAIGISLVE